MHGGVTWSWSHLVFDRGFVNRVDQRGGSDPKYAAIAITSSSDRFATAGFMSVEFVPALEPFCMLMS
jgi:hypothetical protein